MKNRPLWYIGILALGYIASMLGDFLGLFLGTTLRGGFMENLQFAGVKGHGAGGPWGATLLLLILGSLGVWVLARRYNGTKYWPIFSGFLLGGIIVLLVVQFAGLQYSWLLEILPLLLGVGVVAKTDMKRRRGP